MAGQPGQLTQERIDIIYPQSTLLFIMPDELNYEEFVRGLKEKKIRVFFNPFMGLWRAPLPQRYWIMQGVALVFMSSFIFAPLVLLFIGWSWLGYILILALAPSGLIYQRLTIRYLIMYTSKDRKFYDYCIKEGQMLVEKIGE